MASKQPKANIMIAEPGQKFIALKDCHISRCIREGEEVVFSPGQEVPLNLVRLADDASSGGENASQQNPEQDDELLQETEPGEPGASEDVPSGSEDGASGPTFLA